MTPKEEMLNQLTSYLIVLSHQQPPDHDLIAQIAHLQSLIETANPTELQPYLNFWNTIKLAAPLPMTIPPT